MKFDELEIKYVDTLILQHIGMFYQAYNKSSFVVGRLFGYKVKKLKNGSTKCGFPVNSLSNVIDRCKENHINYVVFEGDKGESLKEEFEDNQFLKIASAFDVNKIVADQEMRTDNSYLAFDNLGTENSPEQRPAKSVQAASFIQGQGISLENAILEVQNQINNLMTQKKRVMTVALLENTANVNRGVYLVQGIVVYENL